MTLKRYNRVRIFAFITTAALIAVLFIRPAHAAIAFRAAGIGDNGSGASTVVVNKPTGTVADDIMLAVVTVNQNAQTVTLTPPSGWTSINANNSTTVLYSATYYKVATASEASTYTFTINVAGTPTAKKATGVIASYSGADLNTPINAQGSQVNISSTTMTAPSVTTTAANAMIVAAYSIATGTTIAAGSSMTLRGQATSAGGGGAGTKATSGVQDILQASAGATGTKTATAGAAAVNIGHTIALKPKADFSLSSFRFFENSNLASLTSISRISDPTYGTSGQSIAQTGDGGHVAVGAHIVKYTSAGAVSWAKYRGTSLAGESVTKISDGGFVVVGATGAYGAQGQDVVVEKYDSSGTLLWGRMWGGSSLDYARDVIETSDGGLIIAGYTMSFGSGDYDVLVIKYDSSGNVVWNKVTGGTGSDMAFAVTELLGGGYVVVGDSASFSPSGARDMLFNKYDSSGNLVWSKTWPPGTDEYVKDVIATNDGGFVVTGYTTAYFSGFGLNDGVVAKFDSNGTKEWGKTWGGPSGDKGVGVVQSSDGGYVIAANVGNTSNVSLLKYGPDGTLAWAYAWTGASSDLINGLAPANEGGFVGTGNNSSSQGLYIRYDTSGRVPGCSTSSCQSQTPSELTRAATVSDKSPTTSSPSATTASFSPSGSVNFTPTLTSVVTASSPTGAPLAAQDTVAVAKGVGVPFRARANYHVSYSTATVGSAMKLQVAERSGTCDTSFTGETYSDIAVGSGKLRFYDNTAMTDGAPTSADGTDPTHSTDSIVQQSYEEANNFAVSTAITAGQDGLWDFSLVFDSSATVGSYCIRAVNADGSILSSYGVIPEISLVAPTVGQANYRFFANTDSATPGSPLAAQDTAATVASETPFRLRQRLAVGASQLPQSNTNYKLQYAEKSGVCDTGFSGETYTDVVIPGTPSSSSTYAATAANDASIGTNVWALTTSAIGAPNGNGAQSVSGAGGTYTTNWLKLTNYSFSIPTGATIDGIEVKITAKSDAVTSLPRIDAVRIVKAGTVQTYEDGTDQSLSATYTLKTYGTPTSKWGGVWTPADINNSGFGVVISGVFTDTGLGGAIDIDSAQVTISYTTQSVMGPFAYKDNMTPADFAVISSNPNDPNNGARPTAYQNYRETDVFTNNVAAIPSGSDGLWDLSLTSTSAAAGKTYCLRIVKYNGTPLDSYSQIPEITFSSGGGGGGVTTEQKLRGGRTVQGGVKSPFEL